MHFRFCICDTRDEATCPSDAADSGAAALWWEEHLDVDVISGPFELMLGANTPMAALLEARASNTLVLAAAVSDPNDASGAWVILQGRQTIGATQYARAGAPGTDFPVDGNLTANGDVVANGNLVVGGTTSASGVGTVRDAGGGWVRTCGNTGRYNETHTGGWYMTEAGRLRAYRADRVQATYFEGSRQCEHRHITWPGPASPESQRCSISPAGGALGGTSRTVFTACRGSCRNGSDDCEYPDLIRGYTGSCPHAAPYPATPLGWLCF